LKKVVALLDEGRKKSIVVKNTRSICPKKKLYIYIYINNDHGMGVSIVMVI
jgi:hypothetical protein